MQKNSLNKVLLIGRLGADPEARYTSAGVPVVSFSLATNELWKQKNGEFAEKTEWHNIIIWDKLAEAAQKSLSKGLLVSSAKLVWALDSIGANIKGSCLN